MEKYAMGHISAKACARIEEHLLICEFCRQNLTGRDSYLAAMRLAAAEVRRAGRKRKSQAARKAGGST